jgi:hypothetical protein
MLWLPVLCLAILDGGCNRFRHLHHDTIYVSARQTYLHDRVAAVSNRVAEVVNGQQLEVLERGRRFYKVKTEKNEIGWIEEHAVIDSKTFDGFTELSNQHKQDPVVATAVLRDDLYLHLRPGRDTERFNLVAGNAKVQLLARASVPKTAAPGSAPPRPPAPVAAPAAKPPVPVPTPQPGLGNAPVLPIPAVGPQIPLEDWWLVRDGQGHVGWLLSGRLDVDVPDEIGIYAEGQRIVGAYVLAKVTDPDSPTPDKEIPEFVTVLSPPKQGLPFDFDQVRVLTWSLKRHRYETAFRLHPIQGYLPVKTGFEPVAGGSVPSFSFQIANGDRVATDPATGVTRPASPRTIGYVMIETTVRRSGSDLGPIPTLHQADDKTKGKSPNLAMRKKTNRK